MLHNFGLLPEETIYSGIAAYSDIIGNQPVASLGETFFGYNSHRPASNFPINLDYLASQLVHQLPSSDHLIDFNTVLPYFEAYLSKDVARIIRTAMKTKSSTGISNHLGLSASALSFENALRFCQICIDTDRILHGRAYYHTILQLPEVTICPDHDAPLMITQSYQRNSSSLYVSLETYLDSAERPTIIEDKVPYHLRNAIAVASAWLLRKRLHQHDNKWIRNRYLFRLAELGLASYSQQVHLNSLAQEVLDFYTKDILVALKCDLRLDRVGDSWLARLLRPSITKMGHPLHHILLCIFLGYSIGPLDNYAINGGSGNEVEQENFVAAKSDGRDQQVNQQFHLTDNFFALPQDIHYFGLPPWACLNPFCKNYLLLSITKCEVSFSHQGSRYPIGHFVCDCGFKYTRTGPDQNKIVDVLHIEEFGELFAQSFTNLWEKYKGSLVAISYDMYKISETADLQEKVFGELGSVEVLNGRQPKVSLYTAKSRVKVWAQKLGLLGITKKINEVDLVTQRRLKWIQILQANPNTLLSELHRQYSGVYGYLYKYDKRWYYDNTPAVRRGPKSRPIDYEQDVKLAWRVRAVCRELGKQTNPFVRICLSWVGHVIFGDRTKLRYLIRSNQSRYTLTVRIFEKYAETYDEFTVRKLRAIQKQFDRNHIVPSRTLLARTAHLDTDRCKSSPNVTAVIDEIIHQLYTKYG